MTVFLTHLLLSVQRTGRKNDVCILLMKTSENWNVKV